MVTTTRERERTRVLIAESADLVRQGVRGVLAKERQLVVTGEVARPEEIAPALGGERSPDIILLGLGRDAAERAEALAALRETRRRAPATVAIVLVQGDAVDDLLAPVQAGARGVLLQDAPAGILLEAVRHVLEGGCTLDPRLTRRLFEYLTLGTAQPTFSPEPTLDVAVLRALSPREIEVLQLLCQGLRNKQIAARLGVTVGTVKTHLRHIFRKLDVDDRTGAVLTALQVQLREAA